MATGADQTYRYLRPSTADLSPSGPADVLLSTSGGVTEAGPEANPRFFDGFLGNAEQTRRDVHRYVETLARAATEAARSVHLPPEYAALAEGKTKSVLAAACRQVPRD